MGITKNRSVEHATGKLHGVKTQDSYAMGIDAFEIPWNNKWGKFSLLITRRLSKVLKEKSKIYVMITLCMADSTILSPTSDLVNRQPNFFFYLQ